MSRTASVVAALVAALLVVSLAAPVAAAAASSDAPVAVSYVPPVDAPVVDGFRTPANPYGPGNRGVDFGGAAGDAVRAAADGTVVFAGRIGPSSHAIVLHADGIRTSYSFLDRVTVRRGERVKQGDVVGIAAGTVHFGARAGQEYLDPTTLFGGGPPKVHLIATDLRAPQAEWQERRGLLDGLRGLASHVARTSRQFAGTALDIATPVARLARDHTWRLTRAAIEAAADDFDRLDAAVRALAHTVNAPLTRSDRAALRMQRVVEDQRNCTPASVPDPVRPAAGNLLVLVAGRGSSSTETPLLNLDTASLGYAPDDVTLFSYAGDDLGKPYAKRDTYGSLATAGRRLRQQLIELARTRPGATVDIIAHSQGGLVVRAALSGADTWAPDLPVVGTIATIDTPHHGAVPATAGTLLAAPVVGSATRDLSSSSRLIERLNQRGLPAGANVVSIAGSGDLVVDAQMSAIDDAQNALVRVEGLRAHSEVVTLPATHRELALALAGRGPACRAPQELADDLVLADSVNLANGVRWVADRAADLLH